MTDVARFANSEVAEELRPGTPARLFAPTSPVVLATPGAALGAGAVLTAAGIGFGIEEVAGDGHRPDSPPVCRS
jgi:hypothetical protein